MTQVIQATDAFLRIRLARFLYEGAQTSTLQDVALDLAPGDRVCLLGASGSGKSTLLRILMGLEGGAEGSVEIGGAVHDLAGWTRAQTVFGLVPQAPLLFPWKTVEKNLELALPKGTQKAEARERIASLLQVVGLEKNARQYPWQISLGMASRVSFARALLVPSRALLLDEPFAALDALTRRGLQDWLRARLSESRLPCIFVTHDVREALAIATRIVVLGGTPASLVATFSEFENTPAFERRILSALGAT